MREEDEWQEIGDLESTRLEWAYEPTRLVTFLLRIGPDEHAFEHRYELVRRLIAGVVNTARELDLEDFSRYRVDVWAGQRNVFGHYLDEMFITLAGTTDLPAPRFLAPLRDVAAAHMTGRHPVADGAFPEVRIADGTIEGLWGMTDERSIAFSQEFQARNGLDPMTRDPYRQMAGGDTEPRDFNWLPARPRLGERAIELVSTDDLEAGDVPKTVTRASLMQFGRTFDAYLHHASVEAATRAFDRADARIARSATEPDIDELRTWLWFQARKARDAEHEIELRGVMRVFSALRRALASPTRRALKITPKSVRGRNSSNATARAISKTRTRAT